MRSMVKWRDFYGRINFCLSALSLYRRKAHAGEETVHIARPSAAAKKRSAVSIQLSNMPSLIADSSEKSGPFSKKRQLLTIKLPALKFKSLIVKEPAGYSSLCLDLDVASHGTTPIQAKRMLREAVALYLETAIESNVPYLRPVPPLENPLLTSPKQVVKSFDLEVDVRVVAHA